MRFGSGAVGLVVRGDTRYRVVRFLKRAGDVGDFEMRWMGG
jgi:hypothetical protein